MTDLSTRLARKWCPGTSGSHGGLTDYDCSCLRILAALREALEEAEKVALKWPKQIDNLLPVLFAAKASGDMSDIGLLTGKEIAARIAALRGEA